MTAFTADASQADEVAPEAPAEEGTFAIDIEDIADEADEEA